MKKKIAIICPHPKGVAPGQRLKYEQYFSDWRANDWTVDIYSFQSMRFWKINPQKGRLLEKILWTLVGYFKRFFFLFKIHQYDIVYIFLWVTPFGSPIFERIYCALAKKVVFDIDDLVFLGNASENNSWVSKFKGKEKPIYLMKFANHVITCTPYLDSFVRQYNIHTTDISSTIDTESYKVVNNYKNDHKIILGWSGSYSTVKYLYLLYPMLLKLQAKHNYKLVVMGANANFKLEGIDMEVVLWSQENEVKTIQRFDIGLYPLPDEQWVHGKSGLKALQYMAMGVPTIASKIGQAIQRVIQNDESGYLVEGYDEEWIEVLGELIANPEKRRAIGIAGRERVEKYYSIQANKPVYLSVLNNVLNAKKNNRRN